MATMQLLFIVSKIGLIRHKAMQQRAFHEAEASKDHQ